MRSTNGLTERTVASSSNDTAQFEDAETVELVYSHGGSKKEHSVPSLQQVLDLLKKKRTILAATGALMVLLMSIETATHRSLSSFLAPAQSKKNSFYTSPHARGHEQSPIAWRMTPVPFEQVTYKERYNTVYRCGVTPPGSVLPPGFKPRSDLEMDVKSQVWFRTTLQTNLNILVMGDSVGIQLAQLLQEAMGIDPRTRTVMRLLEEGDSGHESLFWGTSKEGGGSGGYRLLHWWLRRNQGKPLPETSGGGWVLSDVEHLLEAVQQQGRRSLRQQGHRRIEDRDDDDEASGDDDEGSGDDDSDWDDDGASGDDDEASGDDDGASGDDDEASGDDDDGEEGDDDGESSEERRRRHHHHHHHRPRHYRPPHHHHHHRPHHHRPRGERKPHPHNSSRDRLRRPVKKGVHEERKERPTTQKVRKPTQRTPPTQRTDKATVPDIGKTKEIAKGKLTPPTQRTDKNAVPDAGKTKEIAKGKFTPPQEATADANNKAQQQQQQKFVALPKEEVAATFSSKHRDGKIDVLVFRVSQPWMQWSTMSPENMQRTIDVAKELLGVKVVVFLTIPFSNNIVDQDDIAQMHKTNKMIRQFADQHHGSDGVTVVALDIARLADTLLFYNARDQGYNVKPSPSWPIDNFEEFALDTLVMHADYYSHTIAHVCKERVMVNSEDCNNRNMLTFDGQHLCMKTFGGRLFAGMGCVIRCAYTYENNPQELGQCQQACNDQYMTLQPLDAFMTE